MNDEVEDFRSAVRFYKKSEKRKKMEGIYFEQGFQAGLAGHRHLEPKRANLNNLSAWLRGYHRGEREKTQQDAAGRSQSLSEDAKSWLEMIKQQLR